MKKIHNTLILLVILAAFAALMAGAASPRISHVIQHYPQTRVVTGGGCVLNWNDAWVLTGPTGALVIETRSEAEAAQWLAVCDLLPVKP